MACWRVLVLVSLCCLLVGCQARPLVVQSPPTPTAQPLATVAPPTALPTPRPAGTTNASPAPEPGTTGSASPTPVSAIAGQPVASPVPPTPATSAGVRTPSSCSYAISRRLEEVQDRGLKEASGIAASRRWPGIYWALNDSGNPATVYAMDHQGRSRGTFRVQNAKNDDWEALQVGPGEDGGSALYIGDIGDNDAKRREITIYRAPEPEPLAAGSRNGDARTAQAEAFKLQYPDGPRDAEALLIHPQTGEILIVSKEMLGRATVYRVPLPLDSRRTVKMERVAELDMAKAGVKIDVVTDGAVSDDAKKVALRTYGHVLEFEVPSGASLASIWDEVPLVARLDDGPQGEGMTYNLGRSALITIGESTPAHLYQSPRIC